MHRNVLPIHEVGSAGEMPSLADCPPPIRTSVVAMDCGMHQTATTRLGHTPT
jgi:hypothetical protein